MHLREWASIIVWFIIKTRWVEDHQYGECIGDSCGNGPIDKRFMNIHIVKHVGPA